MTNILIEVIPIIFIFIIGDIFRKTGILKNEDGNILLKIIFYFSLPALIIYSITKVKLSTEMVFLPFVAVWIVLITFFVSFFISKKLSLEGKSLGTFLIGSMIIEVSFTLPFIITAFSTEGAARMILFDIGNTIMAYHS